MERNGTPIIDKTRGRPGSFGRMLARKAAVPLEAGKPNATMLSGPVGGLGLQTSDRVHVESFAPGRTLARIRRRDGVLVIVDAKRVSLDEGADPIECAWWESPGTVGAVRLED